MKKKTKVRGDSFHTPSRNLTPNLPQFNHLLAKLSNISIDDLFVRPISFIFNS